jgi:Fe-S cluster biogenesis protein NfuA
MDDGEVLQLPTVHVQGRFVLNPPLGPIWEVKSVKQSRIKIRIMQQSQESPLAPSDCQGLSSVWGSTDATVTEIDNMLRTILRTLFLVRLVECNCHRNRQHAANDSQKHCSFCGSSHATGTEIGNMLQATLKDIVRFVARHMQQVQKSATCHKQFSRTLFVLWLFTCNSHRNRQRAATDVQGHCSFFGSSHATVSEISKMQAIVKDIARVGARQMQQC